MREFEGRTAVVTGAASGIGRALVDRFAQAGMNVVLADIEEDALKRATSELEQAGHAALGVLTDTMRRDSIQNLLEQSLDRFDRVHILCNNAGVASMTDFRPIWALADSEWEWTLGVNLYGVLYGIQAFVPHMLEHGEPGHIVNTASLAGVLPAGGVYGVSKHAVLSLSESLEQGLRQVDSVLHSSVLCPGLVNTRIFHAERNRPEDLKAEGEPDPELVNAMRAALSGGTPASEVAERVFEAIEAEEFYILPHPAWDELVRARVEAIIARRELAAFDLEQALQS